MSALASSTGGLDRFMYTASSLRDVINNDSILAPLQNNTPLH
jgi:hypothetical protein